MSADGSLHPVTHDPFAGPPLAAFVPLTEAQREVWLAAIVEPEASLAYNEGNTLTLRGMLDTEALRGALHTLVERHESLRASVSPDGRWLCIRESLPFDVTVETVPPGTDADTALAVAEQAEMTTGFDLEHGPLVRARLLRVEENLHHLLFTAHHLVCDGWSTAVLFTELAALYSAAVQRRDPALPPAPRYGDYAVIERRFAESDEGRAHVAYWLQRLQQVPPPPELPIDRPRPPRRQYTADRIDHRLDAALVGRLRKAGAAQGASLVAITLAGFATLLHRLSGADDLVVGLAAAGQSFHDQKMLVGHCVNLLPLRLAPRADLPFTEFLRETRATVLDAFEHQGVTFGSLLPKIELQRDETRPPLVSVVFNIDVRDDDIRHHGLEVDYRTMVRQAENFELFVNFVDNGRDLLLECSYNTALFTADSIRARLTEYETLLDAICSSPQTALGRLPLYDAAERARLLAAGEGPRASYPDASLHRLIAEQAARTPDGIAAMFEGATLTHAGLDAQANQLARLLVDRGVTRGAVVAICAQRGLHLLVAILATLKAGAAYLPLDPSFPAERLRFMLADAACPLILADLDGYPEITDEARAGVMQGSVPVIDLRRPETDAAIAQQPATPLDVTVDPDDAAYVIYTSGSTGQPKGTVLSHRGVINRLLWGQSQYPLAVGDRLVQKTPYSFDVSVPELFWPLLTGATVLVAAPESHKDPGAMAALIQQHGATSCHFVPSMLAAFLDHPDAARCTSLRHVFCSGEALPYALTQRFLTALPGCGLHNLYGPTEASVEVSWWDARLDDPRRSVPIGFPVANTSLRVLDAAGEPAPVGVPGELFIGGVQLARGYLNREALTAERFFVHPEFGRLYRTGDRARVLDDGAVEYSGRLDFQLKLNGVRMEAGEIEAALQSHPAVAEAAVTVRERRPGDARLVAYVAWRGAETTASELRAHLRPRLPGSMIPQHIVGLAALPHLANGKLDRKSLPDPFADAGTAAVRTPPRTAQELAVAEIWKGLLGVPEVGIDDRFFDLGGHSMLAVRAATQLQRRFGQRLPLRVVMMDPLSTVAAALGDDGVVPPPAAKAAAQAPAVAPAASLPAATIGAHPAPGLRARLRRLFGR